MKKINKLFGLAMAAVVGFSFASCSDEDYNTNPYGKSGVNILAFGPSPILRTQEIRITGTNMQNVSQVLFPGADPVTTFNSRDNQNIYVNVPDESVPGNIRLVAGRDTIKSEGVLAFEEPIEVSEITPTTGLAAGDVITIKGDYVYNIASVTFTSGVKVLAEDFLTNNRREITLIVPLAAESGPITLSDGNEWEETPDVELEILTAKVTELSAKEGDFGSELVIKGTNLHTISDVMFAGGVKAEILEQSKEAIKVVVPTECKSGSINLVAFSGISVSTEEFAVPTVAITNVSQSADLIGGDVITVTGINFDRIKEIHLPGIDNALTAEQAKIDGNTITITIPEGLVDGDLSISQNSNITVTSPLKVRKLIGVIWMGKVDLDNWNNNWGVFSYSSNWADFAEQITDPGKLTIHFKVTGNEPQFNLKMGDWSTTFEKPSFAPGEGGVYHPTADITDIVLDLSAEEVDKMFGSGKQGIVMWGDQVQVQYVKWESANAGKVLLDSEVDLAAVGGGDWKTARIDGGYDWSDAVAGQNLIISAKRNPSVTDYNNFKIMDSWWGYQSGGLFFTVEGIEDNETTTRVEEKDFIIELTADMINKFKNQGGLNGAGHGVIVTKVVIK